MMWLLQKLFGFSNAGKSVIMFDPQDDITAWERAKLMPLLCTRGGFSDLQSKVDSLDGCVRRHLTVKK